MTKHIKFTIGGFFDGYKTVELSIGTKNVSYKILRNGLNDVDKKNSRVIGLSEEWLADFDALNISSWETDYFNAEILDGTQWELIYKWGKKSYIGFRAVFGLARQVDSANAIRQSQATRKGDVELLSRVGKWLRNF